MSHMLLPILNVPPCQPHHLYQILVSLIILAILMNVFKTVLDHVGVGCIVPGHYFDWTYTHA